MLRAPVLNQLWNVFLYGKWVNATGYVPANIAIRPIDAKELQPTALSGTVGYAAVVLAAQTNFLVLAQDVNSKFCKVPTCANTGATRMALSVTYKVVEELEGWLDR